MPKSVTYVLNLLRYLCPEPAPSVSGPEIGPRSVPQSGGVFVQALTVPHRKVLDSFRRGRHRTLLITFILLFLITPFVYGMPYGGIILAVAGSVVMLAGLYTVSAGRRSFVLASFGAFCVIVVDTLRIAFPTEAVVMTSHILTVILFAAFSVAILADVLRPGKITSDKIYGSICVYLSLGFFWTFLYAILASYDPKSFGGISPAGPSDYIEHVLELRYFSFVTLATLGYGDIVPRSLAARTFATLEAIVGQFYIAILVARLVGLHIIHSMEEKD